MTVKLMATLAAAFLALATLSGCAGTGRKLNREAPVSAAQLEQARFQVTTTRQTNLLVYLLSTAAVAQCADAGVRLRAPLSLLFNENPSDEMRTAIYRVSGMADLPVIQAHTAALAPYEGARIVSINGQDTSNLNKAVSAMNDAVRANKPVELALEDGTLVKELPVAGCPTMVLTDYSAHLKEAFNTLGGTEVTPQSWLQLAHDDNERAFILARSIYFTGSVGESRLRYALYGGAVVSGVVRALTFGVGTLLVDPKTVAIRMRRRANRTEADAFAVGAMRSAGFDPQAALVFAQRSLVESGAWPADSDELKFDSERIAALKRSIE